jgi:hypothetical protein
VHVARGPAGLAAPSIGRSRLLTQSPCTEQISEQNDIADLAWFSKCHSVAGVPGECCGADEPRSIRIADEERRDN